MECVFDNKTNVLNANVLAAHDNSILYTIRSDYGLWGRKTTTLLDANPMFGCPEIAGVIHWKDRLFEVHGQRKRYSEIKSNELRFFSR